MQDVSSTDWIGPRLHPFGQDVGSVIPEGFEAYCRLFHPVETGVDGDRERWRDLARRNQRIVHPEMQFHWISRPVGQRPPEEYDRGSGPSWGSLPLPERRVLVEVLARHTPTGDACWFGVWEGYGRLDEEPLSTVELPQRRYYLYRGPLEKALGPMASDQSPNMWWPQDHSWFVATEVDYAWTYVGGSQGLVDELISDDRLEILPARLSDEPFYDSDRLNEALEPESSPES